MMKYTITIECEDEFDISAITNATKNKLTLEELYDEVFRPVLKYSDDDKLVEAYRIVWERVSAYLEEKDVKC